MARYTKRQLLDIERNAVYPSEFSVRDLACQARALMSRLEGIRAELRSMASGDLGRALSDRQWRARMMSNAQITADGVDRLLGTKKKAEAARG